MIGLPHNVVYANGLDRRSILAGVKAGRLWIAESSAVNLASYSRKPGKAERLAKTILRSLPPCACFAAASQSSRW